LTAHQYLRVIYIIDILISVCYVIERGVSMGGKTSTESKSKYNKKAYTQYIIRIRKDSVLHGSVAEFISRPGTSFNYLVTELLTEYFSKPEDSLPTQDEKVPVPPVEQVPKQKGKGNSNSQGDE